MNRSDLSKHMKHHLTRLLFLLIVTEEVQGFKGKKEDASTQEQDSISHETGQCLDSRCIPISVNRMIKRCSCTSHVALCR
jgi:hypothetical protein